jgi:hypothetical protein
MCRALPGKAFLYLLIIWILINFFNYT